MFRNFENVVINFLGELRLIVLQLRWYQLEGATQHSTNELYLKLTNQFQDHWIGKNGRWSARSPDLILQDICVKILIKNEIFIYFSEYIKRIRVEYYNRIHQFNQQDIKRSYTTEFHPRMSRCLCNRKEINLNIWRFIKLCF